jgi:hypothetical protein
MLPLGVSVASTDCELMKSVCHPNCIKAKASKYSATLKWQIWVPRPGYNWDIDPIGSAKHELGHILDAQNKIRIKLNSLAWESSSCVNENDNLGKKELQKECIKQSQIHFTSEVNSYLISVVEPLLRGEAGEAIANSYRYLPWPPDVDMPGEFAW